MREIVIIAFVTGCFWSNCLAQTDNRISCAVLVKKDSVVLRWVPSSIPVWQTGNKYGYVVKRYTISKGGVFIPDGLTRGLLLSVQPIKPVSNEAFNKLSIKEPRSSVVQEAIYSTEFQIGMEDGNFTGFMKAYDEIEVRFGLALFMCDLSPVISIAAGLQFTDRTVISDERYTYSVSLVNIPDGMQIDPAVVVIDAGIPTKYPPINDIQALFLDKEVKFQWPIQLLKGTYTAFIIEKSTNSIDFSSISDLPVVNLTGDENSDYFVYTDSLKDNYQETYYRVKGISPFGEVGPPSEIIKGKGSPLFSSYAVIDTAEVIDNKNIKLRWRITESNSARITGISILRSEQSNGIFETLSMKPLSPDSRTFIDLHPGISNYYKIRLEGRENNYSISFPYFVQTEDNVPPAIPQMLAGKVDTTGVVNLVWKANTDYDLLGYKIFRANSPVEEFVPLESQIITKNAFQDTINLNTLSREICYRVVAVDRNFNSSDYTSVLRLSRPDTIPPVAALIKRIDLIGGKVILKLEGSPSNDIKQYELYSINEKDSISKKLFTWKSNLPEIYTDVPDSYGTTINYLLKTIDFSDNSEESYVQIHVQELTQKNILLKAEQAKSGKDVILSWDLPERIKPAKTFIYRSNESETCILYFTLVGDQKMFVDSDVEMDVVYNYRVKVYGDSKNEIFNSKQIVFNPSSNSFSEIK